MQTFTPRSLKPMVLAAFCLSAGLLSPIHAGTHKDPQAARQVLEQKLESIRIPEAYFPETTFRAAVTWLRAKAVENDRSGTAKRGINIVVKIARLSDLDKPFSMVFRDGTLQEACNDLATAARLKIAVEPYAVTFVPKDEQAAPLITREFSSVSDFPFLKPEDAEDGAKLKGALVSAGVTFPAGASVAATSSGKLVMRNTQPNLETLEKLRKNP